MNLSEKEKNEIIEYIVTNYTKLMHSAANSVLHDYHEAEDACQEAFLKLYKTVDTLEDVRSTRTRAYCVKTAKNIAVDLARKKAKQIPYEELPTVNQKDSFTESSTAEAEDLYQDIDELPEKYKNIIRLRCFEERSAEETAEMLDSSVSTVNSQLLRARAMLKSKWVSIACLLFGVSVLVAGTLISGIFNREVNYSTVYSGKTADDEVSGFTEEEFALEEEYAAPASGQNLSESNLFKELDQTALKEVEGAAEENITERELVEESDTEFIYKITIKYAERTHVISLSINGEVLSHEITD